MDGGLVVRVQLQVGITPRGQIAQQAGSQLREVGAKGGVELAPEVAEGPVQLLVEQQLVLEAAHLLHRALPLRASPRHAGAVLLRRGELRLPPGALDLGRLPPPLRGRVRRSGRLEPLGGPA